MAEKRKARSKKPKSIVARGKRKEATARATISAGKGMVYYNGVSVNALSSPYVRDIITEPFSFVDASQYDVSVTVRGGGIMGQAQAARTAIANALVEFTGDEGLKKKMIEHDRSLLVEDARRVEPKKFKGPGARARFTKSYR